MRYIEIKNFRGDTIEKLNRKQLQEVVLFIDSQIQEISDNFQIIQYCALKVEIINRLMALHKMEKSSTC